jgi:hypothetical protein
MIIPYFRQLRGQGDFFSNPGYRYDTRELNFIRDCKTYRKKYRILELDDKSPGGAK